jgi:hypothetical protein
MSQIQDRKTRSGWSPAWAPVADDAVSLHRAPVLFELEADGHAAAAQAGARRSRRLSAHPTHPTYAKRVGLGAGVLAKQPRRLLRAALAECLARL